MGKEMGPLCIACTVLTLARSTADVTKHVTYSRLAQAGGESDHLPKWASPWWPPDKKRNIVLFV